MGMSSVSCFTKIHNMSTIKIAIHCTRVFATALHSDREPEPFQVDWMGGKKRGGEGRRDRTNGWIDNLKIGRGSK